MSERTERGTLNHLIEICRDAERGYRHAANHVSNPDLKALFLDIATERQQFVDALLPHARRLGGETETDGTVAGALHRGWMSIRDTLVTHDDAAIISEAERGERAALGAFQAAIEGLLPPDSRDLIESQYEQIQEAHRRVHGFLAVAGTAGER
jgi:uncharacterized protein (TIGR02284 family)